MTTPSVDIEITRCLGALAPVTGIGGFFTVRSQHSTLYKN